MSGLKILGTVGFGAAAGVNAGSALTQTLEYVSIKSAALEQVLAETPQLTEEVYNAANKITDNIASGDLYFGTANAIVAGACLGASLYCAFGGRKEE